MSDKRALIVDDEPDLLDLLEMDMLRMGLDSARAGTVADALDQLRKGAFDLCLTDMRLPDGEGLSVVRHIADNFPNMPVAVITAFGSAESAVAALKAGAFDYVEKPVTPEKVRGLVRSAIKVPDRPGAQAGDRPLVGHSAAMCQVRALIARCKVDPFTAVQVDRERLALVAVQVADHPILAGLLAVRQPGR